MVPVEVLPLVEFQLEPGISDEEAVHLIEAPAPFTEECDRSRGWLQSAGDTFQTMQFDESPASIADPFTARLMSLEVGLSSLISLFTYHGSCLPTSKIYWIV